jgi:hypothetical protein
MTSVAGIQDKRDKIQWLVKEMSSLPQTECPVTDRFAPGCYLREIFMPKDTYVIGKIHATKHFNIILTGKVTVITAEGMEYIEAPYTFISEAGVQKVVYIHEDCQWQTVHMTDKTDLDEIEKEVIAESYDKLDVDGLIEKHKRLIS